jgi:hypothetical protein
VGPDFVAVKYLLHPVDHRPLEPGLHFSRLFCAALDDHLVMADEYWHSSGTLASALSQEGRVVS